MHLTRRLIALGIVALAISPLLAAFVGSSVGSGILHPFNSLGNDVDEGEKIGLIGNPFDAKETEILAHVEGIIIGRNTLPLVNEGDPLFHIAKIKGADDMNHELNILKNDSAADSDFS